MTRAALITNNVVENVIIWGPTWAPPEGSIVVPSEEAQVGWRYDGEKFIPPETPPPTKAELKQYASDFRKYTESLPITNQRMVNNKITSIYVVKTDNTSLARLHRLVEIAKKDPKSTFHWESNNSTVELTSDEVISLNDQINSNIQYTYKVLSEMYTNIDNETVTTLEQISNFKWLP